MLKAMRLAFLMRKTTSAVFIQVLPDYELLMFGGGMDYLSAVTLWRCLVCEGCYHGKQETGLDE